MKVKLFSKCQNRSGSQIWCQVVLIRRFSSPMRTAKKVLMTVLIISFELKTDSGGFHLTGENRPTLVWNKCECFRFVGWNPPIPHFTCTLKPECILLYVCIIAWLAYKGNFHCPLMHINISSPAFFKSLERYSKIIISMCEILMSIFVHISMSKDIHIVIGIRVANVYVYEQSMVV